MPSLRSLLWGDTDPYEGVAPNDGKLDGFHVRCPVLASLCEGRERILETGAHRGASAIHMALCSGGEVLTCDPWALDARTFLNARRRDKYGFAFDAFRRTVVARRLTEKVTYLPMPSSEAFKVCARFGLRFDLAYVDGGHGYETCLEDIREAKALTDGPVVVDDYEPGRFDGVVRAVNEQQGRISIEGRKAIIWE